MLLGGKAGQESSVGAEEVGGVPGRPTCVEDGSKVSFKEKHDRARAVIGIHQGDSHGLSPNFI